MRLTTTRSLLLAIGGMLLSPLGFSQEKQEPRAVEPIPARYASTDAVALIVESVEKTEYGFYAKVRLINPTRLPVCFGGYSEALPWYRLQQWVPSHRNTKIDRPDWEEVDVGWFCGVGLRDCVIKPGESAVIDVRISKSRVLMRAGVEYLENPQGGSIKTVWSPPFSAP